MKTKEKPSTTSKYSNAIELYANTTLTIKDICKSCGLSFVAFSTYLFKHHRDLILQRHNLTSFSNVKLRGKKGQTTLSHYKYKEAIEACDNVEYIEYNISQIARIFDVNCTALANQLRRHYPHIVEHREKERQKLGISRNFRFGVRQWCQEGYSQAIELLKTSDLTIKEASDTCNVSYTGLREHITYYHPELAADRQAKRNDAVGQQAKGQRNGAWKLHEPNPETIAKYQTSVELYRNSSLDIEEIVQKTQVSLNGFRFYLKTWHPELVVERRGFNKNVSLSETKRYKKSTQEKYAAAIERLKASNLSTAAIASEFGLSPEPFRMYLKEHCPELVATRGMTQAANGKTVSVRSASKYSEAVRLYETTTDSLKDIAQRLGLTYNSVGGFIRRNYPEIIQKRKALNQAVL